MKLVGEPSFYERIQALKKVIQWVGESVTSDNMCPAKRRNEKFNELLELLKSNPDWRKSLSSILKDVVEKTDALNLFIDTGLPREDSFFGELFNRFTNRLLPHREVETDLSAVLIQIFRTKEDVIWLSNLPLEFKLEIKKLFSIDLDNSQQGADYLKNHLLDSAQKALIILSNFSCSISLQTEFRTRLEIPSQDLLHQPFVLLGKLMEDDRLIHSAVQDCFRLCEQSLSKLFTNVEETGASLSFVFKLELLERYFKRIKKIYQIFFFQKPQVANNDAWTFVAELIHDDQSKNSIIELLSANFSLVSKKIIEKNKEFGQDQIAHKKAQYKELFLAALGGGVIVSITTIIKNYINYLSVAPFINGLFHWVNYSGTFIWMQMHHFVLATKQPSVTASALASKIQQGEILISDEGKYFELRDETLHIVRSQIVSVVGNLVTVVLTISLIFLSMEYFFEYRLGAENQIEKTLSYLHPLKSLVVLYGALMGFYLWCSSVVAGWIESWWGFAQIKRSISESYWLRRYLGSKFALKTADWMEQNIGGLGGNLSLGFFLAFSPLIATFLGLPLDVRHVTLSTGSLVLASWHAPMEFFQTSDFWWCVCAIFIIGFMNISVSFFLALSIALKAKDIPIRLSLILFKLVLLTIIKNPIILFVYQEKTKEIEIVE